MALNPIGAFDVIGGIRRLRWVRPGYDAYDLDTDQNAVVLDSEMLRTLNVYVAGAWSGTLTGSVVHLVTWPDPGYVPMVSLWAYSGGVDRQTINAASIASAAWRISAKSDGIYGKFPPLGASTTCAFRYIAWRLPADD